MTGHALNALLHEPVPQQEQPFTDLRTEEERATNLHCTNRAHRFLAQVDRALAHDVSLCDRNVFLGRLIEGWERRYANFVRTEGKSEFCADAHDPVVVADFMLVIAGLAARLHREPV